MWRINALLKRKWQLSSVILEVDVEVPICPLKFHRCSIITQRWCSKVEESFLPEKYKYGGSSDY